MDTDDFYCTANDKEYCNLPFNISVIIHNCCVVILLTKIKPLIDSNGKVYTRDAIKPIMKKAAKKFSSFQENSLAEQGKTKIIANPINQIIACGNRLI